MFELSRTSSLRFESIRRVNMTNRYFIKFIESKPILMIERLFSHFENTYNLKRNAIEAELVEE